MFVYIHISLHVCKQNDPTPPQTLNLEISAIVRPVHLGDKTGDTSTVADSRERRRESVDVYTCVVRAHSYTTAIWTESRDKTDCI